MSFVATATHLTSLTSFLIVLVRVKCFFWMCFTATVLPSLQKNKKSQGKKTKTTKTKQRQQNKTKNSTKQNTTRQQNKDNTIKQTSKQKNISFRKFVSRDTQEAEYHWQALTRCRPE